MKKSYPHLLSPIKVQGLVLKNRMVASNSTPYYVQGPEPYPSYAVIEHLAQRAKNGAAVITLGNTFSRFGEKNRIEPEPRKDVVHFPQFDLYDPKCQNYFAQLADAVHYYDTKASLTLFFPTIAGYEVTADPANGIKEFTPEIIDSAIDAYVEQALIAKELGFDMGSIHFAYRVPFAAQFLSPLTNRRTDEYGGGIENRAKVLLEIFRRIKAAAGQDFVLEGLMSAEEPEGGYTFEDTKKFAKMAEGLLDILQVRMHSLDPSHPTGFNPNPTPTLHYAQELKEMKLDMTIAAIGGFQDPDICEDAIASGKADLLGMARSFISDFEYGKKLKEGRAEDIVPCVRCNKCHTPSFNQPLVTGCTVNPLFGVVHRADKIVSPVEKTKRVAVIGGGPGGMEAALVAAERGHSVTLFEKTGKLGGQLNPAIVPDFKWPMKQFLEYMIRQTGKSAVDIRLNTEATPEMIEAMDFDVVLAAVGATPVMPPIKGINQPHVMSAVDALNDIGRVKGQTVVIGGGEIGMETGMYLGKNGVPVTVLEMKSELAEDATVMHYRSMFQEAWEAVELLTCVTNAKVVEIGADTVTYQDVNGELKTISAQTVVIAAGSRGLTNEALEFYPAAKDFYTVGDCRKAGSVLSTMRSAFAAASNI